MSDKYYEILNHLGNDSIKFELLELSGMFYIVKYNAQVINSIIKSIKHSISEEELIRIKTLHTIECVRYQFDAMTTTEEQKEVLKNKMVINYLKQKVK